jgi:hypothetical protein
LIYKAARLRDTRQFIREVDVMVAFFQPLPKTLAGGVVLLIGIVVLVGLTGYQFIMFERAYWTFFVRWLPHDWHHVDWAALVPELRADRTVPKIEPAEHRRRYHQDIQPSVMFWFRYAALATVVFGLLLALMTGYLLQALTFQRATVDIGIACGRR